MNNGNVTDNSYLRNMTARLLGIVGISAFAVVQVIGIFATCNADCNATERKTEELYMQTLSECETKFGAGQCWRMQYQHCLDARRQHQSASSCAVFVKASEVLPISE